MDDDLPTTTRRTDDASQDDAIEATGVYDAEGGTVLYDTEEPLAWIQADHAIALSEAR
jgi:hypothetical protein